MISVLQKPNKFSPSEIDSIWLFKTDNPNVGKFSLTITDAATSGIIHQATLSRTPNVLQGSYTNLKTILSNITFWSVNTDSFQLISALDRSVRSYIVTITEKVLTGSTWVDRATYTSDPHTVWHSELSRLSARSYTQNKYVINSSSIAGFLTSKPDFSKTNGLSAEHLYFIHDGTQPFLFFKIKIYQGTVLKQTIQRQVTDSHLHKMYRLNMSMKSLQDSEAVNWDGVTHYTVQLFNQTAEPRSVLRTYLVDETKCWREHVNVLWVNSLGGLDSYQFHTPQDTVNYTRTTMKTNTWRINAEGLYTDSSNGVFNPSEIILDTKAVTTTRVNSDELNDKEAFWLEELFRSKQAFVELADGSLCPINLTDTSYTIPRQKQVRGQLNTISVAFTLAEGIIPAGASAYSSATGNVSLEFIDSQMNTLINGTTGWEIIPGEDDNSNRQYNPNEYGRDYA